MARVAVRLERQVHAERRAFAKLALDLDSPAVLGYWAGAKLMVDALEAQGDIVTAAGVTEWIQEVEDYDRATEFEALGGKLIELTAAEWKPLAEAA